MPKLDSLTASSQAFWRPLITDLIGPLSLVFSASIAQAHHSYYLNGDAIGSSSITTDNTGGFTAIQQDGVNLGQPAILVSLDGQELLADFRVIVFGLPNEDANLFFDKFSYQLDIWKSVDYFAGQPPEFRVDLGQPWNVNFVPDGPARIIPDVPFGTAGVGGDYATTYDFRFDLAQLAATTPSAHLFSSPLPAGNWVFGFQSAHDLEQSGILRVTGSTAGLGPLPLFSRDGSDPRGILGGQDPSNINLFWGMSLAALPENDRPHLRGDFTGDGRVDAADYVIWRRNHGTASEASLNFNGDGINGVDVGDYQLWRQNFGAASTDNESAESVPEPSSLLLLVLAFSAFIGHRSMLYTRVVIVCPHSRKRYKTSDD